MWLLALLSCKSPDPERLMDTGWFEDTGDATGCSAEMVSSVPEGGTTDWYWRSPLRVFTSNNDQDAYDVVLLEESGYRIDVDVAWGENVLNVAPTAPLAPSTDYVLRVSDCLGTHEVPFSTSHFGQPIDGGPETLEGRTFDVGLADATWVEPGGVGPLLTLFFDSPVLIGIPLSNPQALHLQLAIGYVDDNGTLRQLPSQDSIPFPLVDFSGRPYFEASAPEVQLDFSGVAIPIYDFAFSGTFSADGSEIGGATVRGIGDTRFAGPLLGSNDEDEVCVTAAGLGVQCAPCPTDGQPYCLPVFVEDIEGVYVPGLALQAL